MEHWLFLIPLAPLVAAVVNFMFGRWIIKNFASWIASGAVAISFVLSLIVFFQVRSNGDVITQHLYTWIPAGSFRIPVTLQVDQLTAIMLMVVTFVSLLVHIYSFGYMHGDPGYYRFFSYLPLFVFSMLMLVLADNYLLLFVFWEGVGLCSYLLIGFWYRRRSAAQAAKKAFIVNRIGDFGFTIGVLFIFTHFGTLEYSKVFSSLGTASNSTLTLIALLLFTGAIGKSAQIPLFIWLPDAMEGPTPVSALIHAATMVTAGIFMVARSYPIFEASHDAMQVVATIGAATALVAATIAVTQYDIKKVIAYSTVSQLGYMAFALGVGAWVPAIFHLFTHAFFKGLLFLGAGSVIHGMHEEQDMRRMGNLKKYMPVTYWTFMIGALANAGLFPFAGFWSKDETIAGAWASNHPFIAITGLVAAFFTALYMMRAVFMTFHGTERFDTEHLHPHESPWSMKGPLILLAIPALLVGALVGWPPDKGWFHTFLEPVFAAGKSSGRHNLGYHVHICDCFDSGCFGGHRDRLPGLYQGVDQSARLGQATGSGLSAGGKPLVFRCCLRAIHHPPALSLLGLPLAGGGCGDHRRRGQRRGIGGVIHQRALASSADRPSVELRAGDRAWCRDHRRGVPDLRQQSLSVAGRRA